MANPILEARGLQKIFDPNSPRTLVAINNLNLSVEPNEFVCIVGPSGCGKSTLLRIFAGLDAPTGGEALIKGRPITGPGRERGMVFQEYSLMPWRSVEENIFLGPEFSGRSKRECKAIAQKYINLVKLEGFEKAFPHELSGGMRQRVAIARALANDPEVLLMDEPFGALDSYTRIILQRELLKIWQANRKTVLFITHSVDEAVFLSDRIVVMSARPSRIVLEEVLDIPHPRTQDNPAYGKTVKKILDILEEEQEP
ncbi:MAG: ABC transporter ATP-binding protein [Fretibacterium sp.]|nr:ABC transporter ATP-binding protein [Fretibacterium sp.]